MKSGNECTVAVRGMKGIGRVCELCMYLARAVYEVMAVSG